MKVSPTFEMSLTITNFNLFVKTLTTTLYVQPTKEMGVVIYQLLQIGFVRNINNTYHYKMTLNNTFIFNFKCCLKYL